MAGLASEVQTPGQKPAARLKAASFAKKSASQRVTTNHPHTENNHVNSANFSVNWCGLKFIMRTI